MHGHRPSHPALMRLPLLRAILFGAAIAIVLFFAARMSAAVAFALINPVVKERQLSAEVRQLEQMVAEKKREKKDLQEQKKWWSSDAGSEELAHSKGLIGKDEHTVHILVDPPAQASAPAPAATVQGKWLDAWLPYLTPFALAFLVATALLMRRRRLLRARPVGMLTPRSELSARSR